MDTNKWRQQFPVIVQMICTTVRTAWYDVLKTVHGHEFAYQWWLEHEAK